MPCMLTVALACAHVFACACMAGTPTLERPQGAPPAGVPCLQLSALPCPAYILSTSWLVQRVLISTAPPRPTPPLLKLPGGVRFQPVGAESMEFQMGVAWQFPAFSIALGCSYFQRLLCAMPHLAAAARRCPAFAQACRALPADGQVRKPMDRCGAWCLMGWCVFLSSCCSLFLSSF